MKATLARRRLLRSAVVGLAGLGAALGAAAQVARPDLDEAVRSIVERTNEFRSRSDRPPVASEPSLTAAATAFARYMARTDRYGHEADHRRPDERATSQGYAYCIVLENIAYVQRTVGFSTAELADRLVSGWEESPGHRHNMLDPDVTQTGVALAQSETTHRFYAVQMFGRPKSAAITFRIGNESADAVRYRVGSRSFALDPGVTRTHEQCRVDRLTLPAAASQRGALLDTAPTGGERYVVVGERGGGGLRVERR